MLVMVVNRQWLVFNDMMVVGCCGSGSITSNCHDTHFLLSYAGVSHISHSMQLVSASY